MLDVHAPPGAVVLDPFCGTGTTALVCAERGLACDTTDINPFLLWLAQAKTRRYSAEALSALPSAAEQVTDVIRAAERQPAWIPPLHQIEKWWDAPTLAALGRAFASLRDLAAPLPAETVDLLQIAFCRTLIDRAQVSFGHQSMSFKRRRASSIPTQLALLAPAEELVAASWRRAVAEIAAGAKSPIHQLPRVLHCDARELSTILEPERYSCVVTSPPYPNRMSYIRELRPYMYWLGYLADARAAGELDWRAIGGTWGCATSNLTRWQPDQPASVPAEGFDSLLEQIAERSSLLSRYVNKYFVDMARHSRELCQVVRPGGTVHYIVGNSRFYDVLLPVEAITADLFHAAGFADITIRVIRKRTSKKELFEFVVSARKPL